MVDKLPGWSRHRISKLVLLCVALASFTAASAAQPQETKAPKAPKTMTTHPRSTQEVLDHHMKVFGAADLAGTLSDYAPNAVMFTANGPLRGPQAMTPVFQAFFAEFGKPGMKFTMKQQTVEGNYAQIVWTADTADNVYNVGSDAFVVNNGKIVAHFYADHKVAKPKH
jgi:hypothetical protein